VAMTLSESNIYDLAVAGDINTPKLVLGHQYMAHNQGGWGVVISSNNKNAHL